MKPTKSNVTNEAWHILCDYWSSEKFQESMVEMKRHTESTENPSSDLEIMQQERLAYIWGWSRVPSTRSDSTSSRHSCRWSIEPRRDVCNTCLDGVRACFNQIRARSYEG